MRVGEKIRAMGGLHWALTALLLAGCSDPSSPAPSGDGPVVFSRDAGFYTGAFALELGTTLEEATIYYTVDGSAPDPERVMDDATWEGLPLATRERTFVFEGPIDLAEHTNRENEISTIPTNVVTSGWEAWVPPGEEVQKAVTVRAMATSGNAASTSSAGSVVTNSYFIVSEGRARYTLPVISLATPRSGFFGHDEGIYVPGATGANYDERGEEWERLAHLEFFDLQGERPVAQDLGVRIHGAWTRRLPQKSLRLYSRSDYGTSRLRYRFFESKAQDDFNRLLLRNAGNDWGHSMFRDGALQTLVQHLPFSTQHFRPAILFINGEYWGIHHIRDRLDQHYLETHHGVPRDDVVILEWEEGEIVVDTGDPGDIATYHELVARATGGELTSRADFDQYMDVAEYLDYSIVQWYAANNDWPQNNSDFWRYVGPNPSTEEGPRDGRWRWLMYDVDRSFGYFTTKDFNMVDYIMVSAEHPTSRELFRSLMEVAEIRHEFLQRSAVHLATTLRPERVLSHIDSLAAIIEPEIAEHIGRWSRPSSESEWRATVDVMRDFAGERPGIHRSHLIGHFPDIGGTAEVAVSNLPSGGVFLHTIELSAETPGVDVSGGTWTGELFTGIPVVLTSSGVDLSEVVVSGSGVTDLERSEREVRFVLTGPVSVALPD